MWSSGYVYGLTAAQQYDDMDTNAHTHTYTHTSHNSAAPCAFSVPEEIAFSLYKPAHSNCSSKGGAEREEGPRHNVIPPN